MVFNAEDNKIVGTESVPNPGRSRFLLIFDDMGVNVIISGGMGGAIDIFNQHNIEVIIGRQALRKQQNHILPENLNLQVQVCHEHSHHDECGKKIF